MTSLVGIWCEDGVVIGADSSATFVAGRTNFSTIEQPTLKIDIIGGDRAIVASSGQIGLGQRVTSIVEVGNKQKLFKQTGLDIGRNVSRIAIDDMKNTRTEPGAIGAYLACPSADGHQLIEFPLADFQPELKNERIWYCSMGSAQFITDTFLGFIRGVYWENEVPNLNEGKFAAAWVLQLAIDINPGGVKGPINIATLSEDKNGRWRAELLEDDDLLQDFGHIEEAKQELLNLRARQQGISGEEIPDTPKA